MRLDFQLVVRKPNRIQSASETVWGLSFISTKRVVLLAVANLGNVKAKAKLGRERGLSWSVIAEIGYFVQFFRRLEREVGRKVRCALWAILIDRSTFYLNAVTVLQQEKYTIIPGDGGLFVSRLSSAVTVTVLIVN
jgi:hypothetical protein